MTPGSRIAPVLALVAALVLALPLGPAAAAAGDPPRIDRLTGRVLHTASGDTVTIPVPKRHQNSLELLGTVREGWLVAHRWDERMLIVSPAGRVVRSISLVPYEEYPGSAELLLSGNRRQVLVAAYDRGDQTDATVLGLRGRRIATRHFAALAELLGSHGRAFDLGLHRVVSWRPGSRPRTLADARAVALDRRHDLVVREVSRDGRYAVASLGDPVHPRWTLPLRYPHVAIAPDGGHVLASVGRRILVLAAGDGDVTTSRRLARGTSTVGPGVWEEGGHVLVDIERRDRHALLRCDLHDRCARVVPWQAHPLLGWDYSVTH